MSKRFNRSSILPFALVAFTGLLGCGGDAPTPLFLLGPGDLSLGVGQSKELQATVVLDGVNSSPGTVEWTSSNPAVVTVTPQAEDTTRRAAIAMITSVAPGTATITATRGGEQRTLNVTSLMFSVTPTQGSVDVGASLQLNATVNSGGGPQDVTNSVTWSTSAATVASVTNTGSRGLVRGLNPGSANITARLGGLAPVVVPITVNALPAP